MAHYAEFKIDEKEKKIYNTEDDNLQAKFFFPLRAQCVRFHCGGTYKLGRNRSAKGFSVFSSASMLFALE